MITTREPVSLVLNAAIHSLDGCTRDQSFEVMRAAEFHHRIRQRQVDVLIGRIENTTPGAANAIKLALTESGESLPLHERRIYNEFQRITVRQWNKAEWDELEGVLRVDDAEYRVPQSIATLIKDIENRCVGLDSQEIDKVRGYIQSNEGPWNFMGAVRDFRRVHGIVWAVDWSGDPIAAIDPYMTPSQFLRRYVREIDNLPMEAQKTLLFALSDSDELLLNRQYEFTLRAGSHHSAVVVASYLDGSERKYVMLTRQQSGAEFLQDLPISGFRFSLSHEDLYEDVVEFVTTHKGPWNRKGVVSGFFLDTHGAIRCQLVDDSSMIIPIQLPHTTFMSTYVDENPRITRSGKALINRLAETTQFDFVRGSIKSVYGSGEHGVLVEGHDAKIIRAFFDEWRDPRGAIVSDPFLSERAKRALTQDIEDNPKLPEWRCQGYISRVTEDESGVVILRYDGSSRIIPFAALS
jgi:hypothetical protein